MANGNKDRVGGVGNNRHQVGLYDLEIVVIDGEDEHGLRRGIDQLKQVPLTFFESCVESTATLYGLHSIDGLEASGIRSTAEFWILAFIDIAGRPVATDTTFRVQARTFELIDAPKEKTICDWDSLRELLLECNGSVLVDPVLHHDRREGFIPVITAWTVNGEGSSNAIGVLSLIVAVIPRMSILLSMKSVRVGFIVRDRALSNAVDAVLLILVILLGDCCSQMNGRTHCMQLPNAMPVDRRA